MNDKQDYILAINDERLEPKNELEQRSFLYDKQ